MEKPMHSMIAILPGILKVFSQDRAEWEGDKFVCNFAHFNRIL